jgi:hypothetical protein
VYTRDFSGVWSLTAKLAGHAGSVGEFGTALAIATSFTGQPEIFVGAPFDSSDPTGGAHPVDALGAVYAFRASLDGNGWTEAMFLKPPVRAVGLTFGAALAAFGDTLVIGAPALATGSDQDAAQAVYVFREVDRVWQQEARLAAPASPAYMGFGLAVAVSFDALAIGAPFEQGTSAGINGDEAATAPHATGAVYTFTRKDATWTRDAYIKSSAPAVGDRFGTSVALRFDVLAVGAPGEGGLHSDATHDDGLAPQAGAALLFARGFSTGWRQVGYHKASNAGAGDQLGFSVALTNQRLVVGAPGEDGINTGVTTIDQAGDGAPDTGAFYFFE